MLFGYWIVRSTEIAIVHIQFVFNSPLFIIAIFLSVKNRSFYLKICWRWSVYFGKYNLRINVLTSTIFSSFEWNIIPQKLCFIIKVNKDTYIYPRSFTWHLTFNLLSLRPELMLLTAFFCFRYLCLRGIYKYVH